MEKPNCEKQGESFHSLFFTLLVLSPASCICYPFLFFNTLRLYSQFIAGTFSSISTLQGHYKAVLYATALLSSVFSLKLLGSEKGSCFSFHQCFSAQYKYSTNMFNENEKISQPAPKVNHSETNWGDFANLTRNS